jgi:hypothetical protein
VIGHAEAELLSKKAGASAHQRTWLSGGLCGSMQVR